MQNLRPAVFPEEYSHKSDFKWKQYNVYYLEGTDQGKANWKLNYQYVQM